MHYAQLLLPLFLLTVALPLTKLLGAAKSVLLTFFLVPLIWFFIEGLGGHAITIPLAVVPFVLLIAITISWHHIGRSAFELIKYLPLYFLLLLFYYYLPPQFLAGEKLMDYSLLRHFFTSYTLPLEDVWLSGNYLKYYYFGYYVAAFWCKLFFIPAAYAYFASLALYGLVTLYSVVYLLETLSLKGWQLTILAPLLFVASPVSGFFADTAWDLTRLFNGGHFVEYPLWSFLWGDLHPHVMAYSLVFLISSLLIKKINTPRSIIVVSLFMFILFMTNAWGFLLLLPLCFISLLIQCDKKIQSTLIALGTLFIMSLLFFRITPGLLLGKKGSLTFSLAEQFTLLGAFKCYLLIATLFAGTLFVKVRRHGILVYYFTTVIALSFFIVYHDSYNTIFKFQTPALAILTVVLAAMIFQKMNTFTKLLFVITLFIPVYFTVKIFLASSLQHVTKELRPLAFLETYNPPEYEIINYVDQHPEFDNKVVLEYGVKAYDYDAARVCSYTGLICFLGWDTHLWTRGQNWDEIKRRESLVHQLYLSKDVEWIYKNLKENSIDYVFVGRMESIQYKTLINREVWESNPQYFTKVIWKYGAILYLVR